MLSTRHYSSHRRAWTPRALPTAVPTLAVATVVAWLTHMTIPEAAILGMAVGTGAAQARWWWWRRRHPVITHDQWLADQWRSAPWN